MHGYVAPMNATRLDRLGPELEMNSGSPDATEKPASPSDRNAKHNEDSETRSFRSSFQYDLYNELAVNADELRYAPQVV